MPPSRNVLLITGVPGIGKTTVVKRVIEALPDLTIAGFYTEEIRVGKVRQGFALATLEGKRLVLAHVGIASSCRVGRYGVDVGAVDAAARTSLSGDRSADLFIVDEIGKMECFSDLFVKNISSLLDSGRPLVATIALKGSGFIAAVKKRAGVELREVTVENRDEMPGRVAAWVRGR